MRVPKELPLLLVICLALGITVIAAPLEGSSEGGPSLSSHSTAPGGTLGLYRWLQSLGFRVDRQEEETLTPGDDTAVLFVMAPTVVPSAAERTALKGWVEQGGVLVLVGKASVDTRNNPMGGLLAGRDALSVILSTFGLAQEATAAQVVEVTPAQPLLSKPPVRQVRVESDRYVKGTGALVPLLGNSEQPIAALLKVGEGAVYVLASSYTFSNAGLAQGDSVALLLNWLPAPDGDVTVAIDETTHGITEQRSLSNLVVHQPWGWAAIYVVGIIFVYLALGGRRFGREVRDVTEGRRAAAEYVISMAGLLRRGNKRAWVARHYERALRRHLAQSFNVDPALTPDEVGKRLEELSGRTGELDANAVGRLLRELSGEGGKVLAEDRLVALAAEANKTIIACGGGRR